MVEPEGAYAFILLIGTVVALLVAPVLVAVHFFVLCRGGAISIAVACVLLRAGARYC